MKADHSEPSLHFPFRKHECGYCGIHNHNTEECHLYLMDTMAKTGSDMRILERLAELEKEAMRENIMMYQIPEAVEILAGFGMQYEQ